MSVHNPQVERQLQVLTEMCCNALNGERDEIAERAEPILKSLLMSGYVRTSETRLQEDLETRVKEVLGKQTLHSSEALSAAVGVLQGILDKLAHWESKTPDVTNSN